MSDPSAEKRTYPVSEFESEAGCASSRAAKMFADFDREIAPDKPDLGRLVQIAESHGAHIAAPPV
jgi:hypothetical protein